MTTASCVTAGVRPGSAYGREFGRVPPPVWFMTVTLVRCWTQGVTFGGVSRQRLMGSQTRPDPRRRRPQGPGPPGQPRHPQPRGLRLHPLGRRRPQPPRLQRSPRRREGRHLRRLPPPGRSLLHRTRHHPHRTGSDRQCLALPKELRLADGPGRSRRDRQTHPHLPSPDQRQGRTLQPHPARRVGLPAALHQQHRTHRSPGRLPAHLQPPPLPHRTRRPPTHQPREQPCGSIQLGPGCWSSCCCA